MKKALLLFPVDQPFRPRLESLLSDKGLHPCSIDTSVLFEQIQSRAVSILILDGELFVTLDPQEREQLSKTCRQNNIPTLLTGCQLSNSIVPTELPWIYGIIRNSADEEEWAEKIDTYRHLGRLERDVCDLQKKIEARWRGDEEDLRSAAQIQQSLLPKKLPSLPHFNVSCHFHPFEKIGGDLFSLRQVDEETLMLFLLDVSGHGISSAMVSISVHQSLSLHTGQIVKRIIDKPPYYRLLPPDEVMSELANEYPFERFEMFFTIVYMLINIHTGETTYCSAGHPPPILQRKTGEIQRLRTGGHALLDGPRQRL
jgi:sigma-B regulation protein RsbU (phosphoserine phosphatase)